jgi:ribonuclease HI
MRKKRKPARVIYPSAGPLPDKLAASYEEYTLVFSDASLKKYGGLAAIIFPDAKSPPIILSKTMPPCGSNELELQAALFALGEAKRMLPENRLALFSDNQDAIAFLKNKWPPTTEEHPPLKFCWIKGHGSCRGNILADEHARQAATLHTGEQA